MFKVGNIEIKGKVIIAPLAGSTNIVYRKIMKSFGASLVYTEMVSAKGLIYDNDKTWDYCLIEDIERPVALQLFGGSIEDMVEATKMVCEKAKPDIIDINMGCPVKKVLKQEAGSKMLQDPNHIYEMVKAVKEAAGEIPVSVKIRAGWDHKSINCDLVARKIEEAGASLIAIHGRTKSDLYGGKVNLDFIKMVKDAVSIPVIGNGDIKSVQDAIRMIEYTNVDAIMIGRAALGNPWFVREIDNYFNGIDQKVEVTDKEKKEMIKYHFEELLKLKGEKIAVLEMRTMASYYVKGMKNSKDFIRRCLPSRTRKNAVRFLRIFAL